MSRAVDAIDGNTTVRDALARFFGVTQTRRAYPVVLNGTVIGVVDRTALERLRDDQTERAHDLKLAEALNRHTPVCALPDETCRLVATRLAVHNLERLPVVADLESLRLVGIVSRSDLVKPSITHFEEEHKRERFRRVNFNPVRRPATMMSRRPRA